MTTSRLKDVIDLAYMLGVSPTWIYQRVRRGGPELIPHERLGKFVRFNTDSEAFKSWLASKSVTGYSAAREKNGSCTTEDRMARKSYQEGSIEWRRRRYGKVAVLRYRLRRGDRWIEKTEELHNDKGETCASEREARRAARKRMVEINQTNNDYKPELTFAQFEQTLFQAEMRKIKESTRYNYECMLRAYVAPVIGEIYLDEITPLRISQVMERQALTCASGHSRLNLYRLLKKIFDIAAEFDLVETNPVRKRLHRPTVKPTEKPRLTVEEIRSVIEATSEQHRPMLALMALTGLRIGETLALRWFNVDFDRRRIAVTNSLWYGRLLEPKTSRSRRTIHLPATLAETLLLHRRGSLYVEAEDFVFTGKGGGPMCPQFCRRKILAPALDRAGVRREKGRHGFHLFRHSAASIVYAATGDLRLGQELLGHASLKTTGDIYTHTAGEAREATELLAREILLVGGPVVAQGSELVQ